MFVFLIHVAKQELLLLPPSILHSRKLFSKNWIAASIVMLRGWLIRWTTQPHCFGFPCFLISGRNFPTEVKIKRSLYSGVSGVSALCFLKVCIKHSIKAFGCSPPFWVHTSINLRPIHTRGETSIIAVISPWISASSCAISWSFAGGLGKNSGHLVSGGVTRGLSSNTLWWPF